MGYRTTIKNINSIGHLIEGNVYTFLQQSISSEEMLITNIELLDELIKRTSEQFYMSDEYWRYLYRNLHYLRHEWDDVRSELEYIQTNFEEFVCKQAFNERILGYLERISRLFSQCEVKSILLPGFDYQNPINSLLTDKRTLREIVEIHPGNTALILQLKEQFNREDTAILNIFPNFDKALYQIENWPGIFLWNTRDSLFLPIHEREDIFDIYRTIRYENNSFNYLRKKFDEKFKKKQYAYLLHMSDLHFGNKLANKRTTRVIKILEDHISKIEDNARIIPIISGDLMNSPDSTNKQLYEMFLELLRSKGFEEPVYVLGNHDNDISGILKLSTTQKTIISSLSSTSKVEIYEDLKLAIIKFDSNTGGKLAQGKIGEDQLMEIGNEIDAIKDKESYTFIALLHHHPVEIQNPKWYAKEWYEAILGPRLYEETMKLIDSDLFLEWIQQRGVKYILHGHKHIPSINECEDITIISAGSTTGCVKHQDKGKTFLSYNLIKYDMDIKKPVSVTIIAEEIIGAGTKNVLSHLL